MLRVTYYLNELSWLLILIAAIVAFRRTRNWMTICQAAGAGLIMSHELIHWIISGPLFGFQSVGLLDAKGNDTGLSTYLGITTAVTTTGILLFGIGFFMERFLLSISSPALPGTPPNTLAPLFPP